MVVQFLGRGLTLPFTIIYQVRGFDLGLSGTLMALIAVVAGVPTGPVGSLVDRYGARRPLLVGLVSALVGNVMLGLATDPVVAAAGVALLGGSFGIGWPAINALVSTVVTGTMRQRYFAGELPSTPACGSQPLSSAARGSAPCPGRRPRTS